MKRYALGWGIYLVMPLVMVYGHVGSQMDWTRTPISVYAVHAPHQDAITAAMLLGAASLVFFGVELSRAIGSGWWTHALRLVFAVCTVSLFGLAWFETLSGEVSNLMHEWSFWAFFLSAGVGLTLVGLTALWRVRPWMGWIVVGEEEVQTIAHAHAGQLWVDLTALPSIALL